MPVSIDDPIDALRRAGAAAWRAAVGVVALAVCGAPAGAGWSFTEAASDAGLHAVHAVAGGGAASFERRAIAAGVAAGDVDDDGDVDLFVVGGSAGGNALWLNDGAGRFAVAPDADALRLPGAEGAGPLFADLDGDGDLDLFVGGVLGSPSRLFRNDGAGRFSDVTGASGLSSALSVYSASAGDFDRDGRLDLFLSQWADGGRRLLWRNLGGLAFADVSAATLPGLPIEFTFAAAFADVSGDGWPDLLLAADFGRSRVLINDRDGGFFRAGGDQISDENGMGAAVGDYDNDGDLDWFVSSIWDPDGVAELNWGTSGNRLYRNDGGGVFSDVTDAAGVRAGYWGWGSCFADFDNDGLLDLFHVNGFPASTLTPLEDVFDDDPARLFLNTGSGRFRETAAELGVAGDGQGRGVVCFDADNDGDIDIFVAGNGQPARYYRNDLDNGSGYLQIVLAGDTAGAVGARVAVATGGVTQLREVSAGGNFASQNPARLHVGLGAATSADEIRVTWPDGLRQTFRDVAAGRVVFYRRSAAGIFADDFETGAGVAVRGPRSRFRTPTAAARCC